MGSPGASFEKWLQKELEKSRSGQQLPSDATLAREHGISISTVKRILVRLAQQKLVERVAGKGTFVGAAPPTTPGVLKEPQNAAQRTAEQLYRLLCQGKWKTGEALPSIKFCSLQFHTTPATVIAAYRILVSRGLVTRLGKKYLAGTVLDQFSTRTKREITFFAVCTDLRAVFSTDEFSQAYIRMEHELLREGYFLTYKNCGSLEELRSCWVRPRDLPYGMIISAGADAAPQEIIGHYRQLISQGRARRVPLVIVGGNIGSPPPASCHIISRGNSHTMLARTLATFICHKDSILTAMYVDSRADSKVWIARSLKLVAEVRKIDPKRKLKIVIPGRTDRDQFRTWLYEKYPREHLDAILSKYESGSVEEFITGHVELVDANTPALDALPQADTWIFPRDRDAASFLDYCSSVHLKIPEKIQVISLENNPDYFQRGITSCVRDFQTIGYLMAHVLIGDFPVERTSKGYMRIPAVMLERRTTR